MFSGQLLNNRLEILESKECLLVVFSNYLYIFDKNQTFLINKIKLSQSAIISWILIHDQQKLCAIDQDGNYIELAFTNKQKNNHNKNTDNLSQWHLNAKLTHKKIANHIQDAVIIIKNQSQSSQPIIYYIHQHNLYEQIRNTKNLIQKNATKILFSSQTHLIISIKSDNKQIKIINIQAQANNNNKNNINKSHNFQHTQQITSALIQGNNTLIIGDIKGKIYVYKNYLNNTMSTKLEWHVHQVNHLSIEGQYLYSCGQQGTVVMWHLRQNKRDFLPRIGTEILKVYIKQAIVYCILNDNTISSIDLGNDKIVKNYKTFVNPFGFKTKKNQSNCWKSGKLVKQLIFKQSSTNTRNLLLASGLPGSLQLINMNTGQNNQLQIIPRNLISRLDNDYPQPHEINDVAMNKQWTLMCCSTYGINHNYLHFYKNQGYNYQYTQISKVQNPHKGPISIISYNNIFITFAKDEPALRFWNKTIAAKKSIIQKQEQYFTCSGQINYRNKQIINCSIITQDNLNLSLLLVNYADQLIIVDLIKKCIKTAFKININNGKISKAQFIKSGKGKMLKLKVLIITNIKISVYELNRQNYELENQQVVYTLRHGMKQKQINNEQPQPSVQIALSSSTSITGNNIPMTKLGLLIKYVNNQIIIEYDLLKSTTISLSQNSDTSIISLLKIHYHQSKLLAMTSACSIVNISSQQQFISFQSFKSSGISLLDQRTDIQMQDENKGFEYLHGNFVERIKIKQRANVLDCVQKIELGMYPSVGFGLQELCRHMFV